MDATKAIVLETFADQATAELAASHLAAHSIESQIQTDDCAGMLPIMQLANGVRLLVDAANEVQARDILSQEGLVPAAAGGTADSRQVANEAATPRKVKFSMAVLVVSFVLGILATLLVQRVNDMRSRTYELDNDRDGRPDEIQTYKRGEMVRWAQDRDFDGSLDLWVYYDGGQTTRSESDNNFDGRVDAWWSYLLNVLEYGQEDTDFNGKFDVFHTYMNGVLQSLEWRPNETGVVTLKQVCRNGVLAEEWRDSDRDGQFDVNVKFDSFQIPLQTNQLNLLSVPKR